MNAPDSVYKLVENFQRDEKRFKHPEYNETQLRVAFINPLFVALGWNIGDLAQVSHEDRVLVDGKPKRPDYGFRVNGNTQFFLETKKPALNLKDDPSPAYQLRRYGWSGNLPVSVLSDFEEFIIYDCRLQPQRFEPASKARLTYYRYPEYVDNWDKLYELFSREAVAGGALRRLVEVEKVRGALGVDQAFLREMEGWRESIAKDMALHNPQLTQRQLNHLVQRAIDRIVFLRIAEDRNIESYGRLQRAAGDGKHVYDELKSLFNEADDKYNSGLFHFGKEERASDPDEDSLQINLSNEPLRDIIDNLYCPNSPYEFSVLPADILGQVYERFLGKVIELTSSGMARVEDKPEVRKAGGVYYTPTYIVDYIVENTVGKLLEGKTPDQAAELRILDPACGSDATGLQTAMFAAGGRILPDLSGNIKWGNSLIGSDFYNDKQMTLFDDEAVYKVKPFDWESKTTGFGEIMAKGGFDAVIGNPPYIRIQTMKDTAPETMPYYKQKYVSASKGNYDIYVVFVERGLQLLNSEGLLGFILPHKFFNAKYGEPLRGLITRGNHLNSIVHFGFQQVFEGATTYTCLFLLSKTPNPFFQFVSVEDIELWRNTCSAKSGIIDMSKIDSNSWHFIIGRDATVFDTLHKVVPKLKDVTYRIFQGLKTGSDKFYIVELVAEKDETYVVHSRQDSEKHELEAGLLHLLVKGGDSQRYLINDTARLILFPYSKDGKLISESEMKDNYPLTWQYIEKHEEFLRSRERRKMDIDGSWYAYTRSQALDVISEPKIFTPDIANIPSFSIDTSGDVFFTGGTAGGYGIVPDAKTKSEYLLGLLNSRLLNWQLRHISTSLRGGWYSYESRYIGQLPIRTIDFDNPADVARHDQMVELVNTMLDLHKQLPDLSGIRCDTVQAQIERTDAAIDALVYELYDLTAAEIAIVEGR